MNGDIIAVLFSLSLSLVSVVPSFRVGNEFVNNDLGVRLMETESASRRKIIRVYFLRLGQRTCLSLLVYLVTVARTADHAARSGPVVVYLLPA